MVYIFEQCTAKLEEGEMHINFTIRIFLKLSIIIYYFTIDSHCKTLTFIFNSRKKIPVHYILF